MFTPFLIRKETFLQAFYCVNYGNNRQAGRQMGGSQASRQGDGQENLCMGAKININILKTIILIAIVP